MEDKEDNQKKKERAGLYGAIGLAWELGYSIAIPLLALALSGRFLDRKYETSPAFLLLGIFMALVFSGILVFRKAKKIMDSVDQK